MRRGKPGYRRAEWAGIAGKEPGKGERMAGDVVRITREA